MAVGTLDIGTYKLRTTFYPNYVVHRMNDSWWGLTERWERTKDLGKGGQGFVYLEKEAKSGKLRAVKKLHVENLERNQLNVKRELQHLIAVKDHRDLFVEFLHWYEDRAFIFLAMEYVEHGDLGEYIKKFGPLPQSDAKEVTRQLLQGLVVLHAKHICHRDLKPQNVLIASPSPIRVKLTDFGISKSTIGTNLNTIIGTQGYLAPELQGFRPRDFRGSEYTNAVDLWAFGCLVYQILTSEIPFTEPALDTTYSEDSGLAFTSGTDTNLFSMAIFSEFCKGEIDFPIGTLQKYGVSSSSITFIKRLLAPDPRLRMSAAEAQNSRWWSDLPIFDQKNGSEVMRDQFLSLEIELSPEETDKLFLACSERWDVDIGLFLSPSRLGETGVLLCKAASGGYTLILEMVLRPFTGSMGNIDSRVLGWALLQAAQNGHLDATRMLLANGAQVNYEFGAIGTGSFLRGTSEIKTLLEPDTGVKIYNRLRTALCLAAENGHGAVVKILLENCADIGIYERASALCLAAENGHNAVVKTLLENGADIGIDEMVPALYLASKNGHDAVVKTLLENDIDIGTCRRASALCLAKALLENGADIGTYQRASVLCLEAKNGYDVMVKTLLENYADIGMDVGASALCLAAKNGHDAVVKTLLESCADIGICGRELALGLASKNGHNAVVKSILENGADIGTYERASALCLAAENGHNAVAKTILGNGVDIGTRQRELALYLAAMNGHDAVVKTLLENGVDIGSYQRELALHLAARNGHDAVVKTLLENGADIGTYWGASALCLAAENGHNTVVKTLLEDGVDVGTYWGASALCLAAESGHNAVVKSILENGADIRTYGRASALCLAAENGHSAVVKTLLENSTDIRTYQRALALRLAAENGHNAVVKTLLENDTDKGVMDING